MEQENPIQIYNPHNADGIVKIVQLKIADTLPFLVGNSFHYQILEEFLKEKGISFEPTQLPNSRIQTLGPPLRNDAYIVRGMGEANLYFSRKLYTGMFGKSRDYEIPFNKEDEMVLREFLLSDGWKCL